MIVCVVWAVVTAGLHGCLMAICATEAPMITVRRLTLHVLPAPTSSNVTDAICMWYIEFNDKFGSVV